MNKLKTAYSKPLHANDESGFDFVKEILCNDPTYAINFDRIQKHPEKGYIIFEYLLCDEKQKITPYESHPNRYFSKNKFKFISLHQIAKDLNATLFLVNYAKKNSPYQDRIKVMKVISVDEQNKQTPVLTESFNTTRNKFSIWFRKLNKECANVK